MTARGGLAEFASRRISVRGLESYRFCTPFVFSVAKGQLKIYSRFSIPLSQTKRLACSHPIRFAHVLGRGLEPPTLSGLVPKTSAYTNSATPAGYALYHSRTFAQENTCLQVFSFLENSSVRIDQEKLIASEGRSRGNRRRD